MKKRILPIMNGKPAQSPLRRYQRRRSIEEKRKIVEETFGAGVSVASVALRHGLNANLLFTWRKVYLAGGLKPKISGLGLVPVGIVGQDSVLRPLRQSLPASPGYKRKSEETAALALSFSIEVELKNGVKVRLAGVGENTMAQVLSLAGELA